MDKETHAIKGDLAEHLKEKVHTAAKQAFELAVLAGIPKADALAMVTSVLIDQTAEVMCCVSRNEKLMTYSFSERARAAIEYYNEHQPLNTKHKHKG